MSGINPDDEDSIVGLVCKVFKEFSPCGIYKTPFFHPGPAIRAIRAHYAR
jgi:hypothetical protein